MTRLVSVPASAGNLATVAANQAAIWATTRTQVTVSTDEYSIGRDVACGDWINVWDQISGITDTTNAVRYRGEVIYPLAVRVIGMTWAIERGMGVYYRPSSGSGGGGSVLGTDYVDLSPYVLFESPGTTLSIGAINRKL